MDIRSMKLRYWLLIWILCHEIKILDWINRCIKLGYWIKIFGLAIRHMKLFEKFVIVKKVKIRC